MLLPKGRRWFPFALLLCALPTLLVGAGCSAAGPGGEAVKADGLYAVIETTLGTIVCKLEAEKAPITVGNFVGLAEGTKEWVDPKTGQQVKRPFYDGLKFHRIIKNFMVQGGDPMGTGSGGPGYTFIDETSPDLKHDGPGVMSMANTGASNSNGCQFFITHTAVPHLDGHYNVFGRVVAGQEVVNAMAEQKLVGEQGSSPETDIIMKKVTIVRTGAAAKAFDAAQAFAKQDAVVAQRAAEEKARKAAGGTEARVPGETRHRPGQGQGAAQWTEVRGDRRGHGPDPQKGDVISAHYTGYLMDGTKFDSSVDRGVPFDTPIGVSRVIPGWDEAFLGMKVGEKRRLIIPPTWRTANGARAGSSRPTRPWCSTWSCWASSPSSCAPARGRTPQRRMRGPAAPTGAAGHRCAARSLRTARSTDSSADARPTSSNGTQRASRTSGLACRCSSRAASK